MPQARAGPRDRGRRALGVPPGRAWSSATSAPTSRGRGPPAPRGVLVPTPMTRVEEIAAPRLVAARPRCSRRRRARGRGRHESAGRWSSRLDSVGDVLLGGPAVRAVGGRDRPVDLLCGPTGRPPRRCCPGVAACRVGRARGSATRARAGHRAELDELVDRAGARARRGRDPDLVPPVARCRSALLLRLAGVPRIAAAADGLRRLAARRAAAVRRGLPEDQPRSSAPCAIARGRRVSELPPAMTARLRVAGRCPTAGAPSGPAPFVVVHPGTSAPARRLDRSGSVAGPCRQLRDAGGRVAVTGGPGGTRSTAGVSRDPRVLDLGGRLDLAQLAAVLAGRRSPWWPQHRPGPPRRRGRHSGGRLFAPVVPAVRWAPYGVPVELLGDQDAPCRRAARDGPVARASVPVVGVGRRDRLRRHAVLRREPVPGAVGSEPAMRVLLWHVHGSWTTRSSRAARLRRPGAARRRRRGSAAPAPGLAGRSWSCPRAAAGRGRSTSSCCSDRMSSSWSGAGPAAGPAPTCPRSTSSTTRPKPERL